ncbi:S8 family peptidase [Actinoplanes subglobosus]|uniref:S8 family serine peptidase n=1 Tax=Actinoplanes subglobosus TaxID=1547892 RepID=A0ABV8J5L5_9ACTN
MPAVTYGGRNGRTHHLVVDPELVAVRTHRRLPPHTGPELDGLDRVLSFPESGVQVYRTGEARTIMAGLRAAPDVRFAGRVLTDGHSGEPVIYTENLFVKFEDDVPYDRCRRMLAQRDLTVKDEPGYAVNAFFVAAPEGAGLTVFAIAQDLLDRPEVRYAHPEIVRELGRRAIAPQQWHLAATVVGGHPVDASANVAEAHAVSRGRDVTIAIIDTGIDLGHPEFSAPGKIVAPRDATAGTGDPRPRGSEFHGTACAGVACADGRFGASGVAPEARLMPIRLRAQLGSQQEADAFHWAARNGADVISCSWGPPDGRWSRPDDPRHHVPLPDSTRLAIDHAVTHGRGGKGCLVFFAAGNGNESVDLDGYASHPRVLAVAASNDRGRRSVYSDKGDAIFCAFPSNDFAFAAENRPEPITPGIWTTDITGRGGYDTADYTADFGGTSSACPGAAGVAALVLACNPALTWAEVRDVLRRSCDRIDPAGGRYSAAGHSPWYGFGRLNAGTAVRLAAGRHDC